MDKFQQKYRVRSAECDRFNQMRLRSLFNLFQDVADLNAEELGFGYSFCLQNQLTWMGAGYHLKINRLPRRDETIILYTWPAGLNALSAIRDFELKNEDGETLVLASSSWILIDLARKRPVAVPKYVNHLNVIGERVFETNFEKIALPEEFDYQAKETVREDDIDINLHVNNAVYPSWLLDSLPLEFLASHQLKELKIQFKQGAEKQSLVEILTKTQGADIYTLIKEGETKKEYARILSSWVKKELE